MPKKVLIVDDEVTLLKTLKEALEFDGRYVVRAVNQSTSAIAEAIAFQPDIVVLDVMMPDMDGGELAARMQENDLLKDVPVIFQTAVMSREESEERPGYAEKRNILVKPVSIEKLTSTIEALLR